MNKKILMLLLGVFFIITLSACDKKNSSAIEFKKDYESINGKENSHGKVNRTISIPEDNPMKEISSSELIKKIENKETFFVYFGSKLCPWCRSVIETAIEEAKENNIDTIYYVDIWDDEGNEILRDKYELDENNELKVVYEGTEDYKKLLSYFDNLLEEYTLTNDKEEKISVNEKRIYAPNFVYIEKGKAEKLVDGISSKQEDSREELTKEILEEEEKTFNEFFDTSKSCKKDKC